MSKALALWNNLSHNKNFKSCLATAVASAMCSGNVTIPKIEYHPQKTCIPG